MVLTPEEDLSGEGFRVFGYFRRQTVEAVEALAA
jgi:hypothetical protein